MQIRSPHDLAVAQRPSNPRFPTRDEHGAAIDRVVDEPRIMVAMRNAEHLMPGAALRLATDPDRADAARATVRNALGVDTMARRLVAVYAGCA